MKCTARGSITVPYYGSDDRKNRVYKSKLINFHIVFRFWATLKSHRRETISRHISITLSKMIQKQNVGIMIIIVTWNSHASKASEAKLHY